MGDCIFEDMAIVWNHPVVPRGKVGEFSKGLLHHRTMANLDSRGEGPQSKFFFGRKAAYETQDLVGWMKQRYAEENAPREEVGAQS